MIRVDVFDIAGTTLLGTLHQRSGVAWRDELDGPGSGSVTVPADAPEADLIDYRRVVKVFWQGAYRKAWRITSINRATLADSPDAEEITATGPGVRAALADALVYDRGGVLSEASPEERVFSWASEDGPWRVPAEWVTPQMASPDQMVGIRGARYPQGFPGGSSPQWLWPTDPKQPAVPDTVLFRSTFSLAADAAVRISAAADETLELYVDGTLVISHDAPREWQNTHTWDGTLSAGTHILAARVENTARGAASQNYAGFICAVNYLDDSTSDVGALIHYTIPNLWSCRSQNAYGDPPGWRAASIVRELVTEAQTRGVTALAGLTFGFTDDADTSGVTWPDRQSRVFRIMGDSLLAAVEACGDGLFDFDVDADMTLNLWVSRGTDRTDGPGMVEIRRALNALTGSVDGTGEVINAAAVLTPDGWVVVDDTPSQGRWGRVEGGTQAGSVESTSEGDRVARALLAERAQPQEATKAGAQPLAATNRPYLDFEVGDTVRAVLGRDGTWTARQVTALQVSEDEAGEITYDVDLGKRPLTPQERIVRWLRQAAAGYAGGQLASSSPTTSSTRAAAAVRGGAGGGVVQPTPTDPFLDSVAPGTPGNLVLSSAISTQNPLLGTFTATWDAPTVNGDGSTLDDLHDYLVQWREQGEEAWSGGWSPLASFTSPPMQQGTVVEVRVSARDHAGNVSAPTAIETVTIQQDTTPPPAPSAPQLSSRLGTITVTFDGNASTGSALSSLANDVAALQVHVGTASGFTPDSTTYAGLISGADAGDFTVIADLPLASTVFVRLVAVDLSGNASAPGPQASVTVLRVQGPDIEANSVTTNKIDAGAVTAQKLAAVLTLSSRIIAGTDGGARVELSSSGLYQYNGSGVAFLQIPASGSYAYLRGNIYAQTFRSQGYQTSGYGYIEIGDTGTSDPTDEARFFYGSRVSSIRNPSDRPGTLRISTSEGGNTSQVEISKWGVETDRVGGRGAYATSSCLTLDSNGVTLFAPNYTGALRFLNRSTDGHPFVWATAGGTGFKLLTSVAQFQARDAFDSGYGSVKADTYYYVSAAPQSSSSKRFKRNISDETIDAAALMGLQVKRFQYTPEFLADTGANPALADDWHVGLIAEEVAAAGLDWLVGYGEDGQPESLRVTELGLALLPIVQDIWRRIALLEQKGSHA